MCQRSKKLEHFKKLELLELMEIVESIHTTVLYFWVTMYGTLAILLKLFTCILKSTLVVTEMWISSQIDIFPCSERHLERPFLRFLRLAMLYRSGKGSSLLAIACLFSSSLSGLL